MNVILCLLMLLFLYLQVLRHDKSVLHPIRTKEHLKHVPDYLIPASMRSVATPRDMKRKKRKRAAGLRDGSGGGTREQRQRQAKAKDPLQCFEAGSIGGTMDDGDDDDVGEGDDEGFLVDSSESPADRVFTNSESIGKSTAGRQRWQMRHKKGKFSSKSKSDPRRTPGSFASLKKYRK